MRENSTSTEPPPYFDFLKWAALATGADLPAP